MSLRVKDVVSHSGGYFSAMESLGRDMPWLLVLSPSTLDFEYFSACGDMGVSSLVDDVVDIYGASGDDVVSVIAGMIVDRHADNWRRTWDILISEYDPILQAVSEVTRNVVSDRDQQELFSNTNSTLTNTSDDTTVGGTNTSTEVLNTTVSNDGTASTTNTETRDLETSSNTTTDGSTTSSSEGSTSGTDTVTKTGSEKTATSNTSSKTGSESTAKTGSESRSGDNLEGYDNYGETENGTVNENTTPSLVSAGNETTTVSSYGMGGTGTPAPDTLNTTQSSPPLASESKSTTYDGKSRAYHGTKTNTSSENLSFTDRRDSTEYDTTVTDSGDSTLSFTGRQDETSSSGTSSDSTTSNTDETVTVAGTDSGTVKNVSSDTTSDVAETTGTNTTTDEVSTTTGKTGSADSKSTGGGDNSLTRSDDMNETSQTRSTPSAATVQELVMQEVALRRGPLYNFTQILIDDVRRMTTAKLWPRRGLFNMEY